MKLGTYNGGKGNLYQKLINLMPPHSLYCEPFLGGGAVWLKKKPALMNIGLDMDGAVIDAWLDWLIEDTAKNVGTEGAPHLAIGSATARCDGASCTPSHLALLASRKSAVIARYDDDRRRTSPEMTMPPGNTAISGGTRFEFINGCGIEWLETAVIPDDALIYCDPPYLFETRASQRPLYNYEMTVADHVRFLDAVLKLDCMVMVSGYWSELYADKLDGWETAVYDAYTRSGRKVQEYVWMNYQRPERLHDYRYLGGDYRERERIKRKASRWVAGLQRLPRLERLAILAAMEVAGL